jgi:hypothetical protein
VGIETANQNFYAQTSFEMSAGLQQPEQVHVNSAGVDSDGLSETGLLFGQAEASFLRSGNGDFSSIDCPSLRC